MSNKSSRRTSGMLNPPPIDKEKLEENKITHILVVGNNLFQHYPEKFTYQSISIDDYDDEDLISHFEASTIFIEQGIRNGGILVHW